jgi:photosystem II stability/assembly factor-like uncharacterized protein
MNKTACRQSQAFCNTCETRTPGWWLGATVLLACTLLGCRPAAGPRAASEYAAQVINPQLTRAMLSDDGTLLLWGSDGSILRSSDGLRWDRAAVPTDSDLVDMAADDAGLLVAVGKQGAILRSDDGARRWTQVAGVEDIDLTTVVYHPASRAWLAAGSKGTLLRSSDQARTWRNVQPVPSVAFDRLFIDQQAVLLGGEQGTIGRSDDGGVSWVFTAIQMPEPVTPVTAFHRHGELLLATSALGRLLVSRDAGMQWSLLQTASTGYFTAAAFDTRHAAIVLATHTGQVLRSTDGGTSWQGQVVADGYISTIRYDADTATLLVAGHHGLMARSTDGGRSWQPINTGSTADLNVLLRTANGRGWIAAGEGGSILRAEASAADWQTVIPALKLNLREVLLLPRDDTLVASGELGGVVRSVDGGTRWQFIDVPYPDMNTPPNLRALVVEPRDGALIAAGPPGTIIRSATAGQRWDIAHWTPLQAQEAFAWLTVDETRQRLFAIEAHAVYSSTDGGRQWTRTPLATERELWHASQVMQTGVMVIGGQRGVVMRSVDGNAWEAVNSGTEVDLYGGYADQRSGDFYLLGQQGTLLRSIDAGLSWRSITVSSPHALRRMVRHPESQVLIAFGERGLIVRSADEGRSWRVIASGTDAELRKVLLSPDNEIFLVGQRGVILRSSDAGQSWARLPAHTRRNFRSAVLDPRTGELIVVGERIVRLTPLH